MFRRGFLESLTGAAGAAGTATTSSASTALQNKTVRLVVKRFNNVTSEQAVQGFINMTTGFTVMPDQE